MHRLLWKTLPKCLSFLDRRFTRGYLGPILKGTGNYLMNEKHPLIMVSLNTNHGRQNVQYDNKTRHST